MTSGPGASAAEAPAARDVIEKCWGLVAEPLLARSTDVFQEAFALAARSGDAGEVRAARTASLNVKTLVAAFGAVLRAQHDQAVEVFLQRPAAGAQRLSALSLEQLDDSEVARQASVCAARVFEITRDAAAGARARLQRLRGAGEGDDGDWPLRPEIFIQAVQKTLARELASPNDVSSLLRHFPAVLASRLKPGYQDAVAMLESLGFTPPAPAAKPVHRPAPPPPTLRFDAIPAVLGMEDRPDPARTEAARAGAARGGRPGQASRSKDAQLLEYVSLQAQQGVNAAGLHEMAKALVLGEKVSVPAPPARLLQELMAAQRRDAVRFPQIMAALGAGQDPPPPATPRDDTRTTAHRLMALAPHSVHKLAIQLASRLFVRIERDRLLAAPLREVCACLRFPFIEVALADPSVYILPDHPARRVLDLLGTQAIDWAARPALDADFVARVNAAGQFILRTPGSAASGFAQIAEQLSRHVPVPPAEDNPQRAAAWEALRDVETRALQAAQIGDFIAGMIESAPIDAPVRDFLAEVWPHVIVAAMETETEQAGITRRMLGAVPDLVWSVLPAWAQGERRRLVEALPGLLATLRDGMALVYWPEARRTALLDLLEQAHRSLSRPAEATPAAAPGAAPQFSISTLRIRLDGLRLDAAPDLMRNGPCGVIEESVRQHLVLREAPLSHQWIDASRVPERAHRDVAQSEQEIGRWRDGDWFDLRTTDSTLRLRLEGFTPARTLALFSRDGASKALSLSHASLVNCLRCGLLARVETQALTVRAFQRTLADLKRAASGAHGETDAR